MASAAVSLFSSAPESLDVGPSHRSSFDAFDDARAHVESVVERTTEPFATLEEATRRHIEAALVRTRGRIEGPSGAAALLGLNPHTLRGKMRKLHLDWARFRAA